MSDARKLVHKILERSGFFCFKGQEHSKFCKQLTRELRAFAKAERKKK